MCTRRAADAAVVSPRLSTAASRSPRARTLAWYRSNSFLRLSRLVAHLPYVGVPIAPAPTHPRSAWQATARAVRLSTMPCSRAVVMSCTEPGSAGDDQIGSPCGSVRNWMVARAGDASR